MAVETTTETTTAERELEVRTSGRLQRAVAGFSKRPWLIEPDKFHALIEIVQSENLSRKATASDVMKPEERHAGLGEWVTVSGEAGRGGYRRVGAVAIIPVVGTIIPRASMFSAMSGMVSASEIVASIHGAVDDDVVSTVLFDVDSPGGYVLGVPEAAKVIYEARKKIHVVAHVSEAYSAAYYLASQADEVIVTPSGGVGSVGVLAVHQSVERQNANDGIDVTIIRIPQWKAEANPFEQLTEAARRHILSQITASYEDFATAVARGRGVSVEKVKDEYGKGRTLTAEQGLAVGMVDKIEAWHETLERVREDADQRRASARSKDMPNKPKATETTPESTAVAPAPATSPATAASQSDLRAVNERLDALSKSLDEANARAEDEKKKREETEKALAKAVEEGASTAAKLAESEKQTLVQAAEGFIKGLANLPLDASEAGPALYRIRAAAEDEDVEVFEAALVAANAAAGKSALFQEQTGVERRVAAGAGTSNDKIWSEAKRLVKEGKFETEAKAIAHLATKGDPRLAREAMRERIDAHMRASGATED